MLHMCRYGLILNPKKKQTQLKPSAFGDSSDEEVCMYVCVHVCVYMCVKVYY